MRYLAWTEGKYFVGHKLLTTSQINGVVKELFREPKRYEIFTSIQNYNEEGIIIECPLYADFDSVDIVSAFEDCMIFSKNIASDFGVFPDLYFSGSKGFHAILPTMIKHSYPHLIAKTIVKDYAQGLDTVDYSVYSNRRLFRIPYSFNFKGRKFKIRVNPKTSSLESILRDSEKPQTISHREDYRSFDSDAWNRVVNGKISAFQLLINTLINLPPGTTKDNMTPCIQHLLNNTIEDGHKHQTIFILARFFKTNGVDNAMHCVSLICENTTLSKHQEHVVQVTSSVYNSSNTAIGCEGNSEDALYLKRFCNSFCPFNPDIRKLKCFQIGMFQSIKSRLLSRLQKI